LLGTILTANGLTALGLGYLLGSIPFGLVLTRAAGLGDVRKIGSGNIGATNVFRHLGKGAGLFVLGMDALKGWVAAVMIPLALGVVWPVFRDDAHHEWVAIVSGVASILGHNYTCWLNFKGGKGIATSAGALLALVPLSLLIGLAVWLLVAGLTRYVSLASIAAAAVLPLASWISGYSWTFIGLTGALAVLAIYKHKANIQRLLNGTENRITPKRSGGAAGGPT
jgi:glycerol-3-phosphate acyltransferase PlsY